METHGALECEGKLYFYRPIVCHPYARWAPTAERQPFANCAPTVHQPCANRAQFHPNIYPDGTLCMDLIQDNWSPIYSVCSIMIAIRSLLTDPNCASPANPEAAHLYHSIQSEVRAT